MLLTSILQEYAKRATSKVTVFSRNVKLQDKYIPNPPPLILTIEKLLAAPDKNNSEVKKKIGKG